MSLPIPFVHQSPDRLPYQLSARPEDIQRHEYGKDGVKGKPARKQDQHQSDDDAETRPGIRQNVLAVGDEDERMVLSAFPDKKPAQRGIDDSRTCHEKRACVEVFQLQTFHPLLDGFVHDVECCEHDHRAFKSGAEERNLVVSVWMGRVGGLEAQPEAERGESNGEYMDDGFGSIRKNRGRSRDTIRVHLPRQHNETDAERKAHGDLLLANGEDVRGVQRIHAGLHLHNPIPLIHHPCDRKKEEHKRNRMGK